MAGNIAPRIESALNPITALAFLDLGTSGPYLFAGEGQFLKIFHAQRTELILTERLLNSQAIHGIACESLPRDAGSSGTLLIWGGRSICLVSIEADLDINGEPLVKVRQHMPEVLWDDWILDGCFRSTENTAGSDTVEAILVTAHNDLVCLKFATESAETRENPWLYHIASGPSSILYSAHMLWVDAGPRLLVAAGTVFGEVLLWSFALDHSLSPGVCLHYRFTGHQGSVFGVRISEAAQTGVVKRILASCSDDRTIRIWNISDTSNSKSAEILPHGEVNKSEAGLLEETNEAASTGCLAMIMGHASRIWGLRFLIQKDKYWELISYGEDSTAQVWHVSPVLDKGRTIRPTHDHTYQLSHQATYSYHSGKNLWAMAVFRKAHEDCIAATGGADGCITSYKPLLHRMPARTASWTGQYTMDEIFKTLQTTSRGLSPTQAGKAQFSIENIFDSLKGSWKLSRNLDSLVSLYPSGTLSGIATFAERLPTDDAYDAEYLYSESGNFITQQGLTMRATRQYVYRYRRATDAISVWFVKPDDDSAVDYFFHKLDFRETEPGIDPGPAIRSASGYHLCVEDNYNANYSFQLRDSKIVQWHAVFDVDGPKKDFTAKATYTRDHAETLEPKELENMIPPSMKKHRSALGNQRGQNKPDAFKTYTWISENEVLATTEHGNLLVGSLTSNAETTHLGDSRNVSWEHVSRQTSLISSCIATSIPSLGIALLTGADGTINRYNHRSRETDAIVKLPGKAGFLKAQSLSLSGPWNRGFRLSHQRDIVGVIATCLGSSRATVFMYSLATHTVAWSTDGEAGFSAIHECHITLQSNFIVTTSCFLDTETWLILGSRNGDIAIYDLAHTTPNLALDGAPNCFQNVHGEDAITLIQTVPGEVSKLIGRTAIITAGRDGKWAIHRVFYDFENSRLCVTLQTIHVGVPPFGPNIEGARFDSTRNDLLLWGFRSKQFVVWNESQKTEVMAVDCGGAHRNWAYTHNQGSSGGGSFAYTKASVCHIHSQTQASHQVVQHGGHGREIKAMALSPEIKTNDGYATLRLVATGAEDTAIRIFDLNANLKCLSIITKHTTGIHQLRWSCNGQLLFSAGGCEEFFVWRLQPAPLVTIGVVCEASCPAVTEEAELRIMDFATEEIRSLHYHDPDNGDNASEPDYLLSTVYSDSSVRLFRYSSGQKKKTFELLTEGSYTTYCLTQATHLHIGETRSGLCTASTDGHLAFWPLPNPPLLSCHDDEDHLPTTTTIATRHPPLHYTTRTAIHQSSVKALDCVSISPSETLVVTGGDDGAIALTRVGIRKESEVGFGTASLLVPGAHASAVTGVVFLREKSDWRGGSQNGKKGSRLASVGNDQRLKIWEVTVGPDEKDGVDVSKAADVYTSVADASSLGTYRGDADDGQRWLLVAGIGVERWRIGDPGGHLELR